MSAGAVQPTVIVVPVADRVWTCTGGPGAVATKKQPVQVPAPESVGFVTTTSIAPLPVPLSTAPSAVMEVAETTFTLVSVTPSIVGTAVLPDVVEKPVPVIVSGPEASGFRKVGEMLVTFGPWPSSVRISTSQATLVSPIVG